LLSGSMERAFLQSFLGLGFRVKLFPAAIAMAMELHGEDEAEDGYGASPVNSFCCNEVGLLHVSPP
jgi:hypothetical protein